MRTATNRTANRTATAGNLRAPFIESATADLQSTATDGRHAFRPQRPGHRHTASRNARHAKRVKAIFFTPNDEPRED